MSVIKPSLVVPGILVSTAPQLTVEVQTTRRIGAEVLGRRLTVADLAKLAAACGDNGVPGDAVVHFGDLAPSDGVDLPSDLHTARVAQVLDCRAEPAADDAPERCGECQMGLGTHNPRSPACTEYTAPVTTSGRDR